MVISYFGEAFIRVTFGDIVIALNPPAKSHSGKAARFGADVAMVSCPTPVYDGVLGLTGGGKEPFVIAGPGEYEYSDIFIKGYESPGPDGTVNTIYSFLLEGMRVVHLGALSGQALSSDTLEEISGADIMIVPAGEEGTLPAKAAAKFAASLEPKIIIPVLYGSDGSSLLSEFLSEMGETKIQPVEKLAIKKKDLEGKEADIVVLQTV